MTAARRRAVVRQRTRTRRPADSRAGAGPRPDGGLSGPGESPSDRRHCGAGSESEPGPNVKLGSGWPGGGARGEL